MNIEHTQCTRHNIQDRTGSLYKTLTGLHYDDLARNGAGR